MVDRVLCCGNDGSVRLVSPLDGTILTTMLPPCDKESDCYDNEIVDAVYCLPLESIYAVYGDGGLHRASTLSSPADAEFLFKFDGGFCCLLVADFFMRENFVRYWVLLFKFCLKWCILCFCGRNKQSFSYVSDLKFYASSFRQNKV